LSICCALFWRGFGLLGEGQQDQKKKFPLVDVALLVCARPHPLKIRRSFQLGINGDRAPCVSVLAMPVEPIILEPFALESRRLCVAPPGRRSRLRCSGDLPPQRRTVSRPCLSWRAKGPDSSTQLPIVWSMMPSETERGEGEATRARIGAFRSSQGPPGQRRLRKHPTCELPPLD
jgi:hypothetical protein